LICLAITIFGAYTSLRIYFGIFTVICALFIPLLYKKLIKTKKLSNTAVPVKKNLQALILLIKEYIKRYFQLTMVLIPISLIISFALGYSDENLNNPDLSNPFFPNFIGSPFKITIVIIYVIAFSFGMYYFTKWYLKKLYGNYVQQLEALLAELEEAE
jgi:MFS family permease